MTKQPEDWRLVGHVSVDAARIHIADFSGDYGGGEQVLGLLYQQLGTGVLVDVQMDGAYPVYVRTIETEYDEVVAEIRIKVLDD